MIKKIEIIFVIALFAIILIGGMTQVNAADTFQTSDGIVVKKVVDGFTNGSIELDISNVNLSSEGNYTWGISKTSNSDGVEKWYAVGDMNPSKKTAKINLTVQEEKILNILKVTDTVYLYIKNNTDNTFIINGLQLDVSLPPLYAFDLTTWLDNWYIIGGNLNSIAKEWNGATYNIKTAYYKFEKITDTNLVGKYKQALLDNTSLTNVFNIDKNTVENKENWTSCTRDSSYPLTKIDKSKLPTDQGVYYLWLKAKDTDSKTVYGCLIVNIDGDGPKVERIYVSSPNSGTYKTGQTVKIQVGFNEAIKGSTMPTLKIKFGESAERTLTNGTLVNTGNENQGSYWNHYIEYSYNIQSSDVGQLATVSLSGGNIKDSSDNDAKLSCPVITGNTIKANVEGTTTTP